MFVFKAAVVGAGTMGAEIAQLLAARGHGIGDHEILGGSGSAGDRATTQA